MEVAITGATGFIGQYVVEQLRSSGHTVVAIGRSKSKLHETFPADHVHVHTSDYTLESLRNGFEGVDAVVHLAAKRAGFDPTIEETDAISTNVQLTRSVFNAAAAEDISRICQSSSISVYPLSEDVPFFETQRPMPPNMYGLSKVICENMADIQNHNQPIEIVSLRIASVYGHGERSLGVFMKFVEQAKNNQILTVHGQGRNARDFIYVRDVASAVESAITSEACGVFNIGSGRPHTISEIAKEINEVFDNGGNLRYNNSINQEVQQYHMDCSKAREELGWVPEYSLNEALKEMRGLYQDK